MDNVPVPIDRESFRTRLGKLKRGIAISWIVNFLLLSLTIEAALIFTFLSSRETDAGIANFLLITFPIALAIAAISMAILLAKSWKSIVLELGTVEVDPATTKYLRNIVEEMSIAAGLRQDEIPEVGVIPSDEPNAFALAGKEGALVAVTTGLLRLTTREELQGVIAHEIGHLITGDSKAMTKLIAMSSVVGILSGIATRMFSSRGGGDSKNPLAIGLILLSLIFLIAAPFLSQLANTSMQRKRESQADATAVRLTRNPSALATALRKIDGSYGSIAYPKRSSVDHAAKQLAFFSRKAYRTHPTIEERVLQLKRMGADPAI